MVDDTNIAAVQLAGDEHSSGKKAGRVLSETINRPDDKVIDYPFTLDGTSAIAEYIIYDFEKIKDATIKITGIAGAELVSIQGDMSSDQSGLYTSKLAAWGVSGVNLYQTGTVDLSNNSYRLPALNMFTALRVYVSTADAGAGGTLAVTVTGRGKAQ